MDEYIEEREKELIAQGRHPGNPSLINYNVKWEHKNIDELLDKCIEPLPCQPHDNRKGCKAKEITDEGVRKMFETWQGLHLSKSKTTSSSAAGAASRREELLPQSIATMDTRARDKLLAPFKQPPAKDGGEEAASTAAAAAVGAAPKNTEEDTAMAGGSCGTGARRKYTGNNYLAELKERKRQQKLPETSPVKVIGTDKARAQFRPLFGPSAKPKAGTDK